MTMPWDNFQEQFKRMTDVIEGRELKKKFITSYFESMKSLSDEELEAAVGIVVETFIPSAACRFPLPSHIHQAARVWLSSKQAVPQRAVCDDDEFRAIQQRTEETLRRRGQLPKDQYRLIEEQATQHINERCPGWFRDKFPDSARRAVEGHMIELFCTETGTPLPSDRAGLPRAAGEVEHRAC